MRLSIYSTDNSHLIIERLDPETVMSMVESFDNPDTEMMAFALDEGSAMTYLLRRNIIRIDVDDDSDKIDYAGLQADLDELEATDPDVAAAARRFDNAVPDMIARTLSSRRKGDIDMLAQTLWDTNAESMGWLDCYKNAEAIVAAGWVPRCNDHSCVHTDHTDHATDAR